jgi:hypothetical protein
VCKRSIGQAQANRACEQGQGAEVSKQATSRQQARSKQAAKQADKGADLGHRALPVHHHHGVRVRISVHLDEVVAREPEAGILCDAVIVLCGAVRGTYPSSRFLVIFSMAPLMSVGVVGMVLHMRREEAGEGREAKEE